MRWRERGQYFQCYLGFENFPAEYFNVIDDNDRAWKCVALTREEGESSGRGFPATANRIDPECGGIAIMWVHDEADLPERLSGISFRQTPPPNWPSPI